MIYDQIDELKKITGSSQATGWVKENVAHFLSGFVRYADLNLVLNIGHLWGKSALVFCDAMFNEKKFENNWSVGDQQFRSHTLSSKNQSEIKNANNVIEQDFKSDIKFSLVSLLCINQHLHLNLQ